MTSSGASPHCSRNVKLKDRDVSPRHAQRIEKQTKYLLRGSPQHLPKNNGVRHLIFKAHWIQNVPQHLKWEMMELFPSKGEKSKIPRTPDFKSAHSVGMTVTAKRPHNILERLLSREIWEEEKLRDRRKWAPLLLTKNKKLDDSHPYPYSHTQSFLGIMTSQVG